jgi:hypothetical protein
MNIGIIGSGNMGASMGQAWARNGHKVLSSFSTDPAQLRSAADAAGPNARMGTPPEAAAFADVILLAVPWGARSPRRSRRPGTSRVKYSSPASTASSAISAGWPWGPPPPPPRRSPN